MGRIIDALNAPNPDEQTVLGRLTPEQYARAAKAEREEMERAYRKIGYGMVAAFTVTFLMFVAWLALR